MAEEKKEEGKIEEAPIAKEEADKAKEEAEKVKEALIRIEAKLDCLTAIIDNYNKRLKAETAVEESKPEEKEKVK